MTDKLPSLEDAYALSSRAGVKKLYADWAQSYDSGFGDAEGYQLPRAVAQGFVGAGGSGPVLDFGAGTGLVGEVLATLDIGPLDAVDLSAEMLAIADGKAIYRATHAVDVLSPSHGLTGGYAGIVSAGTFTLGHVGPDGLAPLLDFLAPGGCVAISINAAHYRNAGFEQAFDDLGDRITGLSLTQTRIYDDRAHERHRDDMAFIATFRKT